MSIEKSKEELKERMLNARAMSDDELEKVSGGGNIFEEDQQPGAVGWGECINPNCPLYAKATTVITWCGEYVCQCCHEEIPNNLIDFHQS